MRSKLLIVSLCSIASLSFLHPCRAEEHSRMTLESLRDEERALQDLIHQVNVQLEEISKDNMRLAATRPVDDVRQMQYDRSVVLNNLKVRYANRLRDLTDTIHAEVERNIEASFPGVVDLYFDANGVPENAIHPRGEDRGDD